MDIDQVLIILGFFAFCGGLIDADVVGGSLVQLPALMHALPQYSLATVFGTNKLAVLAGTSASLMRYIKKINIIWHVMLPAFVFAFLGAMSVDYIPKNLMRYAVFFLLIVMAIYTFAKKRFRPIAYRHAHGRA